MCHLNMCVECFIILQHLTTRKLVIPKRVLWQTVSTHPGLYIEQRFKQSSGTERHHNISIESLPKNNMSHQKSPLYNGTFA